MAGRKSENTGFDLLNPRLGPTDPGTREQSGSISLDMPESNHDLNSPEFDPMNYTGSFVSEEDRKAIAANRIQRGMERLQEHIKKHPGLYDEMEIDPQAVAEPASNQYVSYTRPNAMSSEDMIKALHYPDEPDLQEAGKNNEFIYHRLTPFQQRKVEAQIIFRELGLIPPSNAHIGLVNIEEYDGYPISAMCSNEYEYLASQLVADYQSRSNLEQQNNTATSYDQYVSNETVEGTEDAVGQLLSIQPGKISYLQKPSSKYYRAATPKRSRNRDNSHRRPSSKYTFIEPRRSSRFAPDLVEDLYSLDIHKKGIVEQRASQEADKSDQTSLDTTPKLSDDCSKTPTNVNSDNSTRSPSKGRKSKSSMGNYKQRARLSLMVILRLPPAVLANLECIFRPQPRSLSPPGVFQQKNRDDHPSNIWPHLEMQPPKTWDGKAPYTVHDMVRAEEAEYHRSNAERLRTKMAYLFNSDRAEKGLPPLSSIRTRASKNTQPAPTSHRNLEAPANSTSNIILIHKHRPNPDYNTQRRMGVLSRSFEAEESLRSQGLIPPGLGPPPVDVAAMTGPRNIDEDIITYRYGANAFMSRSQAMVYPIEEFRPYLAHQYQFNTQLERVNADKAAVSEGFHDMMDLDDE